jgi:gliding motility-associated-like protein
MATVSVRDVLRVAVLGALLVIGGLGGVHEGRAQSFGVEGVQPRPGQVNAADTASIAIAFTEPVALPAGDDAVRVYGSHRGRYAGSVRAEGDTLRFTPDCPLRPGEVVSVTVTDAVTSTGGAPLARPYVWQFTVRSKGGQGEFDPGEPPVELGRADASGNAAKVGGVSIPPALRAADYNGDLQADVATINQASGTLEVRYGPALEEGTSLSVPGAVTVGSGDLNGDGRPDLVTVHSFEDSLGIVLNGPGGLTLDRKIATGARPTDVVVADLNGDGAQDLAVAPFGGEGAVVHLNDGTGSFSEGQPVAGGAAPTGVVARDVDRDGDLDLLTASSGEEAVEWLENDGAGTFALGGRRPLPFAPAALVARDVLGSDQGTTGDGRMDLVVSAQGSNRILAYENREGEPFAFAAPTPVPSPSSSARALSLVDIDGRSDPSNDLDLVSTHRSASVLQTATNESRDGFAVAARRSPSVQPAALATLDLDRDRDQDLVVAGPQGTALQVFRNSDTADPLLARDPASLSFGEICIDSDSTATVTITNRSAYRVAVSVESVPEGFEVRSSALPDTLAAGGERTLRIAFDPGSLGAFTGQRVVLAANELTETCGRPTPPQGIGIPVSGTGIGTEVAAAPDTLRFGEVFVDSTQAQAATIQNDGNITAEVSSVEGLDGSPFAVADAPDRVPAGRERSLRVRFTPGAADSTYTNAARLVTTSRCGTDTTRVVLRGTSRPPRPDLRADELAVGGGDPDSVRATRSRGFVCRFANRGRADAEQGFAVALRRDGETVERVSFDGLAAGETARTDTVDVGFPSQGEATVACAVDADEEIDEEAEDNNTIRRTLQVTPPPAPDLAVGRLAAAGDVPSPVRVSDTLSYACTVANRGSERAEGPFAVQIIRNGAVVADYTYDGLGPDEERTTDDTAVPIVEQGETTVACVADAEEQVDERGRTGNNRAEQALDVAPPPAPDLAVGRLEATGDVPSPVRVTDTLSYACTVANRGIERAEGPFAVQITRDGAVVAGYTYDGLGPDEERTTDDTAVPIVEQGETTVACVADPEGQVNERGRTGNNRAEQALDVAPAPAPDLVAREVVVAEGSASDVQIGDTLAVACQYGNRGLAGVQDASFDVRIARGGIEVGRRTVDELPAGDTQRTDPVQVPFPEQGAAEVTCQVDPAGAVGERGRVDNNEALLSVTVQKADQLPVAPNPFTPNGDGINDRARFDVTQFGLEQPVLSIYTFEGRRLQTVQEMREGELRWDGTGPDGEPQPPGVYLYIVREDGRTVASGHITLAR